MMPLSMLPSYLNSQPEVTLWCGEGEGETPPHHTLSYEGGEREPAAAPVAQPLGVNSVRVDLLEEPGHHHQSQTEEENGGDHDTPHLNKRQLYTRLVDPQYLRRG